jgi:hypothetical protein
VRLCQIRSCYARLVQVSSGNVRLGQVVRLSQVSSYEFRLCQISSGLSCMVSLCQVMTD